MFQLACGEQSERVQWCETCLPEGHRQEGLRQYLLAG